MTKPKNQTKKPAAKTEEIRPTLAMVPTTVIAPQLGQQVTAEAIGLTDVIAMYRSDAERDLAGRLRQARAVLQAKAEVHATAAKELGEYCKFLIDAATAGFGASFAEALKASPFTPSKQLPKVTVTLVTAKAAAAGEEGDGDDESLPADKLSHYCYSTGNYQSLVLYARIDKMAVRDLANLYGRQAAASAEVSEAQKAVEHIASLQREVPGMVEGMRTRYTRAYLGQTLGGQKLMEAMSGAFAAECRDRGFGKIAPAAIGVGQ